MITLLCTHMILVDSLIKKFGKLTALNNLSLDLQAGNSYALIGPNGSGKTTLIKSILGMVIPDAGDIRVAGTSIRNQWDYRSQIGYMPQIGRYPDNMRMGQVFDMLRNIRQHTGLLDEELLDLFALPAMFDKRMHTLSGGTRQKVSAALAFLFDPPILILDEPTAGLDPVSVEVLKEKIQRAHQRGKLVVITSHVMSDLDDLTSNLIYLYDGQVRYHDTVEALKEITGEQRLGRAVAQFMTHSLAVQPEKTSA